MTTIESPPRLLEFRIRLVEGMTEPVEYLITLGNGRLTRVPIPADPDPGMDATTIVMPRQLAGSAADRSAMLEHVRVVVPDGYDGPLPPLAPAQLGARGGGHDMPPWPGASFRIQRIITDGPFGPHRTHVTYADGAPVSWGYGGVLDPDVIFEASFDLTLRFSLGEVSIADVLAEGGLVGSPDHIAASSGIAFGEEHLAIQQHLSPVNTFCRRLDEELERSLFDIVEGWG